MGDCFDNDPTIHFVGGQGTKAGHATPGGATLDWFETQGSGFSLSDIMDANGGPLNATTTGHSWTQATKTLTASAGGGFTGAEVGMIVYVSDQTVGGPYITTGRYKITATDGLSSITLGDMASPADYDGVNDGTDVTVCIGGAYASMDAAIGSSSGLDAAAHDVHVFDNLDETSMSEIVLGVTGSLSNNAMLRYWGYNTTIGDRLSGGASEGTWTSKAAGANTLLDPDANDNVAFYCLHLQNNDANDATIEAGTSTDEMRGWLLQHCKVENAGGDYCIGYGVWKPLLVYDCDLITQGAFSVITVEISSDLSGACFFVDTRFTVDYSGIGDATLCTGHAAAFVNCSINGDTYGNYGFINGGHHGQILINCTNAKADHPSGQNSGLARVNNANGWVAAIRCSCNPVDAGDDQQVIWVRDENGGTVPTVSDCNHYSDNAAAAPPYIVQQHLDSTTPSAAAERHNWWWLPSTYCRQVENDLDADYQTGNDTLKRGADNNLAIGRQLPLSPNTVPQGLATIESGVTL